MNVLFVCHIDSRPPLGVMYLSASLRRAGHRTAVANLAINEVKRALHDHHFDAIAFSYPSCFAAQAAGVARAVRREFPGLILAGGPHPTFHPRKVMEEPAFDAVCVAEAEAALPEALTAHAEGKGLTGLANFVTRNGAEVVEGLLRPLADDLDALPFPDRDLFRGRLTFGEHVQPFLFSRGCPYQCTYCFEPVYRKMHRGKGQIVRRRSVENVIEELMQVKRERDLRLCLFYDDTFNVDPAWVERFCIAYERQVKIPFYCKVRADGLSKDTVRSLSGAGCKLIFMGIEHGSEDVRRRLLNRKVKNTTLVDAARLIRGHGIKLVTYNIAGVPFTDAASDLETLDVNLACNPDATMVMFMQPYAGTPMRDMAVNAGMWSAADDRRLEAAGLGLYAEPVLRYPDARTRRRVQNVRDLFGITLAVPAMRPLLPWLAELPAHPLYGRMGELWYIYCHLKVLYPGMASFGDLLRGSIRARFPRTAPGVELLEPWSRPIAAE